jgi:nicotinate-nucleotide pyrophosphorylase (carboxylating)
MGVVEEALARLAILEDVGEGDLTAACIPAERRATALITAREEGIASGLGVAARVFEAIDASVVIETLLRPGERFAAGARILLATGSVRSLLTAERSALNFLQRLCGIATLTARYVEAVRGTGVRITDTRKTAPGLRFLEKEAVRDGGGINHRLGLYDAVMIKDNHIEAAGGIPSAVAAARVANPGAPIVVEARTQIEAEVASRLRVGRILLDNMPPDRIPACVASIRAIEGESEIPAHENRWIAGTWRPGDRPIQIEVSGGIHLENVRSYALPGVDFISVGALTHSARALDLTMDLLGEA